MTSSARHYSATKQNEIRESEGEGERCEQNIVSQSSTHFLPPKRTEVLMCRRRKHDLEHMLIAHSHYRNDDVYVPPEDCVSHPYYRHRTIFFSNNKK